MQILMKKHRVCSSTIVMRQEYRCKHADSVGVHARGLSKTKNDYLTIYDSKKDERALFATC